MNRQTNRRTESNSQNIFVGNGVQQIGKLARSGLNQLLLKSPYISMKFWKNNLSSVYKLPSTKRHFGNPNRKNHGKTKKYGHWKYEKHQQLRSENSVGRVALGSLTPTFSFLHKFQWCLFFYFKNVFTTVWPFIILFGGIKNLTHFSSTSIRYFYQKKIWARNCLRHFALPKIFIYIWIETVQWLPWLNG